MPWVFKFKVMHRASWKKETKETCKHFRETQERSHRDVFVWNGNGNEIATFKIHFLQQKKHTINGTNIYMVRISCNYSSDGHFLFAFFFCRRRFRFRSHRHCRGDKCCQQLQTHSGASTLNFSTKVIYIHKPV